MAFNFKNTKMQGNFGLGTAIAYFTRLGYTVSVPLTDSQGYDLIVENGKIDKVQIKTVNKRSKRGVFRVNLKSHGRYKNTPFDSSCCDSLFVVTGEEDKYHIPIDQVRVKNTLDLSPKYDVFKVI